MKTYQKLILALFILMALVSGLWAWKRETRPAERAPSAAVSHPSPYRASDPAEASAKPAQAAEPPSDSDAAARKFIDMPARERRELLRQIKATDADELLKLFLDAGRIDQDPMKQSMLQGKLTGSLMEKKYAPDFIERMKRFVTDGANAKLERGLVISAFARSLTKEGAEFILWVVANETDMEVRAGAIGNISGLGGAQPYLPPMIEPLWRDANDPDLIRAVAHAMANEAAPSSIELLLNSATAGEGVDDIRQMAASRAITKVYRAEAVPPLAAALNNSAPGSPLQTIALSTLGQIGDKSAPQAVISWLQAADKSAAPLVAGWIGRGSGSGHLTAAEAALNPSVPFRAEENREAIRAAIAAQQAVTITDRAVN